MNEDKKSDLDAEKIMVTIDHIGETIDNLSNILNRLKSYMNTHAEPSRTEQFMALQKRTSVRRHDGSAVNESEIIKAKKNRLLH